MFRHISLTRLWRHRVEIVVLVESSHPFPLRRKTQLTASSAPLRPSRKDESHRHDTAQPSSCPIGKACLLFHPLLQFQVMKIGLGPLRQNSASTPLACPMTMPTQDAGRRHRRCLLGTFYVMSPRGGVQGSSEGSVKTPQLPNGVVAEFRCDPFQAPRMWQEPRNADCSE